MTKDEQYDKAYSQLESVLGKEQLEHIAHGLAQRYGKDLNEKMNDAVRHVEHTYSAEALGEMLEDGQFGNIDTITEFVDKGSEAQLDFESMADESGVEPVADEDYDGLNYDESMSQYD